jgi:hypothetical protein
MVVISLGHVQVPHVQGQAGAGSCHYLPGRIMYSVYALYAVYVNGMPLTPAAHQFLYGIYERNWLHARDHTHA